MNPLQTTPYSMIRLCGLPTKVLEDLRFHELSDHIAQIELTRKNLFAKSEILCDDIYQQILNFDAPLQKQLINFKRKIFNLKKIKKLPELGPVLEQVCPEIWQRLVAWDQELEAYFALIAAGEEVLLKESLARRESLKQQFANEDFQKGLLASSSAIYNSCREYIRTDQMKKKHYKMEHKLLLYYLRCVCKTSPFATFTTVSQGTFGPEIVLSPDDLEKRAEVNLNVTILETLLRAVFAHPTAKQSLTIALNSTVLYREPFYYYLREVDQFLVQRGNIKDADLFKVRSTESMELLEKVIRGNPMSYEALTQNLKISVSGSTEEIEDVIDALMEIDFLVIKDDFTHLLHEPFERLRRNVAKTKSDALSPLIPEIEMLESLVDEYRSASLQRREKVLNEVSESVANCYQILDLEAETWDTYIYEDTTIARSPIPFERSLFDPFEDGIAALNKLTVLFSTNLVDLLNMTGFFKHHFRDRTSVPFLEFYEAYYKEYFLMHGLENLKKTQLPNPFECPEIEILSALRTKLMDYVASAEETDDEIIFLEDALIQELIDSIPETMRPNHSKAFYVQLQPDEENPLLVVNNIYPGRGNQFTRFTMLFKDEDDICKKVETRLKAAADEQGVAYAELSTNFASNLNIHKRLVSMEILLPTEQGYANCEMDKSLELKDMSIRVHEGKLQIFDADMNKPVLPIYMGSLYPPFLGDIYRIVNAFSDNDFAFIRFPSKKMEAMMRAEESEDPNEVLYIPRVQYKNLVLRRAAWCVPVSSFPQRHKSETAFLYYLRVRRWFAERKLPRRCFFKFATNKMQKNKPNYLDLDSYFILNMFIRDMGASADKVIEFSELLPDQEIIHSEEGPFVSEVVLESTIRSWR